MNTINDLLYAIIYRIVKVLCPWLLSLITLLMIGFYLFVTVQENAEQGAVAFLGVVQVRESDLGIHL